MMMMMMVVTCPSMIFGVTLMKKRMIQRMKKMARTMKRKEEILIREKSRDQEVEAVDLDQRMRRNVPGGRGHRALRVVRVHPDREAEVEKRVEEGTEENPDVGAHPAPPPVGPGLAASVIRKALRRNLRGAALHLRREEVEGGERPPPPAAAPAVTPDGQGFEEDAEDCWDSGVNLDEDVNVVHEVVKPDVIERDEEV